MRGGLSVTGRPARSPLRGATAGVSRPAAPAGSGVCSNQAAGPPPRVAYGLNAKPDAPVAVADHVGAVCEAYQHAPAVARPGGHGIRTEEKPGRQARARAAPPLPRQPRRGERPA
jgi:hypothetical protein